MKKGNPGFLKKTFRPFITGVLTISPLVITLAVIVWVIRRLQEFMGPESSFGNLLQSVGLTLVSSSIIAYIIGMGIVFALIYFFGVLVQSGLRNRWNMFVDSIMRHIPLLRSIYDATKKLTWLFGGKDNSVIKTMSPVMINFGGKGGTLMLGLMSSKDKIDIDGKNYYTVMIPTAPVPFGGAIFYVPEEWIKPTNFSFDGFLNVYMSMGVTSTDFFKKSEKKKK